MDPDEKVRLKETMKRNVDVVVNAAAAATVVVVIVAYVVVSSSVVIVVDAALAVDLRHSGNAFAEVEFVRKHCHIPF